MTSCVMSSSGVDAEGQQLLGVHVVERAQVGQPQQQLGEARRVVCGGGPVDEEAQRPDQVLLQLLHRRHVLHAGAL